MSGRLSVKLWVAFGLMMLLAVTVIGYDLTVPLAGVPFKVAVPSPLSWNVTAFGREPLSLRLGVGTPVDLMVNAFVAPTVNVVDGSLVMVGACPTVNVKLCVALGMTPLFAVIVKL